MTEKKCSRCEEVKPVTEFYKQGTGFRSHCKECGRKERQTSDYKKKNAERQRQWTKANPDAVKDGWLRKNYNITLAQYNEMLLAQGHRCLGCERHTDEVGTLQVDHDHSCCAQKAKSCGKCIRGLLCSNCNRAIGLLNDNPMVLVNLADYLGGVA